MHLTGQMEKLQ